MCYNQDGNLWNTPFIMFNHGKKKEQAIQGKKLGNDGEILGQK